jgi:hypothetical protein
MRDALISGGIGLATWVFVFLATFLVHFLYFTPKHQSVEIKEERDSFETQLESLRDLTAQRRQEQREQMAENCVKMLKAQKIGMLAFHAIARHEAYKLESEDLDWVCDEIQKFYGFHPFADLDAYVPPKDRKEFLRWVCLSPD